MKKKFTILIAAIAAILMMAQPMKALADHKTASWDLTSTSSDWTASNCETYFSQPYGMKKANAYIVNANIADFSTTGTTSIKIGVKSLQNGGTTSVLTVYLVDKDGKTVGSGQTITPVNASSASNTTYQYVTFTSGFTGVKGFKVQCTTFGKNILINGANYDVTYTATAYTVTLGDDNSTLTETSAGAGVTLPSRSDVSPYTFAGWITSNITTEITTAPETIIPAGPYYPTEDITLFPVYTRTEGGGTTDVPVSVDISEYAEANNWGSSTSVGQKVINIDSYVTATASKGTNTGKYYSDGWRLYESENATVTIETTTGTLKSVAFTFTNSNNGTLNYNSSALTSGTAVNVSGTSAEFSVSRSSGSSYGQIRVTQIDVTYTITGTTYYISVVSTGTPSITSSNVEILYNATGGSIEYSINEEPDPAGTLTAAIKEGTTSTITNLTFGTITNDEVQFTCDANSAFSAHTATVTLTYTYGNNETVTKDVTITQAATPIVLSSITLSGTYQNVFIQDDAFSNTGIVVTAHYNDESTSDVTSSATCSGYDMSMIGEQTVTVSYTESGVTKTATYTITVNAIPNKTIAQFISDEGGKCYITGTVSNIVNTTYGNFDLTDESGTIYVYGCLTSTGASGQFSTLGIEEDDVIKVLANEYLYYNNTTHEAKNVKFIEKIVPNPQTLTVNATNGSVEITGKTLVNGSCEVAEGANVTATATPADHYTFTSWSATGVTLANNTANPLTFTMPTNGVTLTANFTENAKHNATFYVLGVEYGTDANVYEGSAITFPSVTAPNGYTFMGWTTAAIVGTQDGAPATLVTAANMGNANIDYYAVFAIQTGGDEGTVELTNSTIQTNREGKTSYGNYTIGDWSGKFMINKNGEVYSLQLGYNASSSASAYNSHLTTPECPYNITSITISTNNNTASGRTFYLCSASNLGAASSIDATYGSGSTAAANGSVTINVSGNTKQFHIYPNGTAYIASVTLTYSNVSYSSYCTTVNALDDNILPLNQSFELENDFTITTGTYYLDTYVIVPDGITLTVDGTLGNSDPDFIVIEDGGQLICSNSVAATVKKSIANANAKDPKNHWYTISAPVHTGTNNYVTIGASTTVNLTNNGAYDMFAYDEPTHYWLNQKAHGAPGDDDYSAGFDIMTAGQGYMYRNSGNELSYVGNTTVGPVNIALSYTSTLDVEGLKGFNLIGNPYTHSIAKGSGKAIVNVVNENTEDEKTVLSNGCYVLSNSGTWTPITDGNEIKPNQGVLVETSAAVADFQIQDINYVATSNQDKYNNDNIQFTVANSEYEDVAYAWFGKGYGLTKISHRDLNAPMLYIPQDGHNYAIATMSDDVKVFGLNFKTATMGQYTLSYKADGNFDYLHIIDRLTGKDIDMLLEGQFTFMANKNDSENRFIVKLGYSPDYSEGNNDIFAYQTGSEILVSGSGELQIFDVTGRQVMTTTINGAESISVPAQGVYIFRLVGNEVKTQKIVVR